MRSKRRALYCCHGDIHGSGAAKLTLGVRSLVCLCITQMPASADSTHPTIHGTLAHLPAHSSKTSFSIAYQSNHATHLQGEQFSCPAAKLFHGKRLLSKSISQPDRQTDSHLLESCVLSLEKTQLPLQVVSLHAQLAPLRCSNRHRR